MDEATFLRTGSEIMKASVPIGCDDLLGMEIDCGLYFRRIHMLQDAHISRTDDPERLLTATATAKPDVTVDQVAEALRHAWVDHIRYRHCEAHVVIEGREAVRLLGVTQIAADGFYVTLEATARL